MKKITIIVLLLALPVALGYALRELFFEKTKTTVDKGLSGEASYNPYFALRELFIGLGAGARTVSGLGELPPADHALVLAMNDRPLVESEVEKLLSWVEEGGHLVVPARPKSVSRPFLAATGVDLFDEALADEDDHLSESPFETERPAWPKLFIDEEYAARLVRSDGESDAAWAITARYGRGLITIPVTLGILGNRRLGAAEHAAFAWWLVSGRDDARPAGVWIAYRQAPVSVWVLLASRARPVVLALALLSAASLALLARPFGPRLEAPPRDRRHLDEHLQATGRYLWDREVEHELLRAVQDEVERRIARGGQPSGRQLALLVQQAAAAHHLDARELQEALQLRSTRDPQQFTDTIHILEQLRRKA